ncbi:hypothetical protein TYRP_023268 [Tyrophagus putrescentiae]|nr:hypothetical protein TYRP_023268 [Tyrophagus putrescentiae]
MARLKSSALRRDNSRPLTAFEPALLPKMVTESLLLQKWSMFSAIQHKPTSWLCKPRLLTAAAAAAEDENEKVPAGTRVARTAGGPGRRSIATSYN